MSVCCYLSILFHGVKSCRIFPIKTLLSPIVIQGNALVQRNQHHFLTRKLTQPYIHFSPLDVSGVLGSSIFLSSASVLLPPGPVLLPPASILLGPSPVLMASTPVVLTPTPNTS